jgi:hypothetical protein
LSIFPASLPSNFSLVVGTEDHHPCRDPSGYGLLRQAVHEEHAYCRPSAPFQAHEQTNQASF